MNWVDSEDGFFLVAPQDLSNAFVVRPVARRVKPRPVRVNMTDVDETFLSTNLSNPDYNPRPRRRMMAESLSTVTPPDAMITTSFVEDNRNIARQTEFNTNLFLPISSDGEDQRSESSPAIERTFPPSLWLRPRRMVEDLSSQEEDYFFLRAYE